MEIRNITLQVFDIERYYDSLEYVSDKKYELLLHYPFIPQNHTLYLQR